MPIASVLGGLIDFVLAFLMLIGMMFYYGMAPTVNVVWLPFFVMLTVVTSLGSSLWLSAMYVQFRDVRHIIPFLTQIWMFATPIAYPSSLLEEPWRTVYGINPMVGVVEGFRWALLGTKTAPGPYDHFFDGGSDRAVAVRCILFPSDGKDIRGCRVVTGSHFVISPISPPVKTPVSKIKSSDR